MVGNRSRKPWRRDERRAFDSSTLRHISGGTRIRLAAAVCKTACPAGNESSNLSPPTSGFVL